MNMNDKVIKDAQEAMKIFKQNQKYLTNDTYEAIRCAQSHMSSIQDVMTNQLGAMSKLHESIWDAVKESFLEDDTQRAFRETMKRLQVNALSMVEAVKKNLLHDNLLSGIEETMKSLQLQGNTFSALQDSLATQLFVPMESFFRNYGIDRNRLLDAISEENWPEAYADISEDFVDNGDQVITVDSKSFSYLEIQNMVSEITEKAFEPSMTRIEHVIAKLIAEIRSKDATLIKILAPYIFQILMCILTLILAPIADHFIKKELTSGEKKQAVKQMMEKMSEVVEDKDQLKAIRLVSANTLNVRLKPSNSSQALGTLKFGNVVVLVKKEKAWSLVEWSAGESELRMQGWVFSRYLKKIK